MVDRETSVGSRVIPPYVVQRATNQDEGFYADLGPFLSRRDIVGELGSPVWDDDGKVWFVAKTHDNEVLGCVGVTQNNTHALVSSLYVVPEGRKQVIGATLLLKALTEAEGEVRAVVTDAARELFGYAGFEDTGTRGRFTLMTRLADD